MTATRPGEGARPVPLEPLGPLSRSILWQLQRRAYEGQGPDAWRSGAVPFFATSNPAWVDACAAVVLGYLRDCQADEGFDPAEPVTAIELGAGHGRFGYGVVRRVLERIERSRLRGLRFRYVLTDLAEANIAAWLDHPRLAPLLEAGVVDVARFDVTVDEVVRLQVSGEVLGPGSCTNPGVVLANYLFDSIPQDLVAVEDGQLLALHVALTSSQEEPDLEDPGIVQRMRLGFHPAPYDPSLFDPVTAAVLERRRAGPDVAAALVPSTGLGCLARLQTIWDGRLLLLTGDKGQATERDHTDQGLPEPVRHGAAFSLSVDHRLIADWFAEQGGRSLLIPRSSPLHLSASILGFDEAASIETEGAYRFEVAERDPWDFVHAVITDRPPVEGIARFLTLLRTTGYDPVTYVAHILGVADDLAGLDDDHRDQLQDVLEEIWDRYFPIGESLDVPYYLAFAHRGLGDRPRAIAMLEHSLELHGPTGPALRQLAVCRFEVGDLDGAEAAARRAAGHDGAEDVEELLAAIAEARGGGSNA